MVRSAQNSQKCGSVYEHSVHGMHGMVWHVLCWMEYYTTMAIVGVGHLSSSHILSIQLGSK